MDAIKPTSSQGTEKPPNSSSIEKSLSATGESDSKPSSKPNGEHVCEAEGDGDLLLQRAQANAAQHPLLTFKPGMTLTEIQEQRKAAELFLSNTYP